jgi:hypothetical protein
MIANRSDYDCEPLQISGIKVYRGKEVIPKMQFSMDKMRGRLQVILTDRLSRPLNSTLVFSCGAVSSGLGIATSVACVVQLWLS